MLSVEPRLGGEGCHICTWKKGRVRRLRGAPTVGIPVCRTCFVLCISQVPICRSSLWSLTSIVRLRVNGVQWGWDRALLKHNAHFCFLTPATYFEFIQVLPSEHALDNIVILINLAMSCKTSFAASGCTSATSFVLSVACTHRLYSGMRCSEETHWKRANERRVE